MLLETEDTSRLFKLSIQASFSFGGAAVQCKYSGWVVCNQNQKVHCRFIAPQSGLGCEAGIAGNEVAKEPKRSGSDSRLGFMFGNTRLFDV